MRFALLILFIAAFVPQIYLILAYWVMRTSPSSLLMWLALALSGVCVALMIILAVITRDTGSRWLSIGLIGIVALAFSALSIVSIGLLIGPISLAIIVASIVMLIRNRRPASSE